MAGKPSGILISRSGIVNPLARTSLAGVGLYLGGKTAIEGYKAAKAYRDAIQNAVTMKNKYGDVKRATKTRRERHAREYLRGIRKKHPRGEKPTAVKISDVLKKVVPLRSKLDE